MKYSIEINPRVCNGKPVLKNTRIPVTVILDLLADGDSFDDIQKKYPEIGVNQFHGIFRYCHDMIENTEIRASA